MVILTPDRTSTAARAELCLSTQHPTVQVSDWWWSLR